MALRRRRQHHRKNPRGTLLAFIALAIQAMLPFFLAVEMARAVNPAYADTIPICSSLGHLDDGSTSDRHQGGASCPVCAAVAASQSFASPAPLAVPMPRISGPIELSVALFHETDLLLGSPYQSRGPPTVA
jgi:hypothetical protein